MSRTTDRIKSSWAALVRHLLPPTIDLYAYYPAKVVGQSSDGTTVDVQPDSARLPGMTALRLRLPPGYAAKVDVSQGPRVMIGWEEGDPSRPFATPAWDPSTAVLSVTVTGGAVHVHAGLGQNVEVDTGVGGMVVLQGGALPVARQTDTAGPYPIVGGNPGVLA